MRSNRSLERTVRHRGPRLAAAQRRWPAAQLGRWIRLYAIAMKKRCCHTQTEQYRSIDALYETGERCYKAK
jgi:hypothetical protein